MMWPSTRLANAVQCLSTVTMGSTRGWQTRAHCLFVGIKFYWHPAPPICHVYPLQESSQLTLMAGFEGQALCTWSISFNPHSEQDAALLSILQKGKLRLRSCFAKTTEYGGQTQAETGLTGTPCFLEQSGSHHNFDCKLWKGCLLKEIWVLVNKMWFSFCFAASVNN